MIEQQGGGQRKHKSCRASLVAAHSHAPFEEAERGDPAHENAMLR
jgi:hypothetical protein